MGYNLDSIAVSNIRVGPVFRVFSPTSQTNVIASVNCYADVEFMGDQWDVKAIYTVGSA